MAGDLDYDKTVTTLQKYFGSWKGYGKVSAPEYQPQPVLTTPQDTSVVGQNNEALMMGWRFERGNALQMDTLDIINQLLCNGKAGLFDADLNQKMKVQSIDDGLEKMHDYSFFYMVDVSYCRCLYCCIDSDHYVSHNVWYHQGLSSQYC